MNQFKKKIGRRWLPEWIGLGLRPRLISFVILATLPLMVLIVEQVKFDRSALIQTAQDSMEREAQRVAQAQIQMLKGTQKALQAVGQTFKDPFDKKNCTEVLNRISQSLENIQGIAIIDIDGRAICSSTSSNPTYSVADRSWFKKLAQSHVLESSVSGFLIGRDSKNPTIVSGIRLETIDHRPWVLSAGIKLKALADLLRDQADRQGDMALVIDMHSQRIIASYPNIADKENISTTISEDDPFGSQPKISDKLYKALNSASNSYFQVPGPDGQDRVFGVAPLVLSANLMVLTGIQSATVLKNANKRALHDLWYALIIEFIAISFAWFVGELFLMRPIRDLGNLATRFGNGDMKARIELAPLQAIEFKLLGGILNDMASRINDRDQAVASAKRAIERREAQLRLLADNVDDVIARLDNNFHPVYVSPSVREMTGYSIQEILENDMNDICHPEDLLVRAQCWESLRRGQASEHIQFRLKHKDGHYLWIDASYRAIPDGSGAVAVLRDITRRKIAEDHVAELNRQLEGLVLKDSLTGIGNRRQFDTTLMSEAKRALQEMGNLSLLMIDVDYFKAYNDNLGHQAGDEVLKIIASSLKSSLFRAADLAVRYGGEELGAILPETDLEHAQQVAERIRRNIEDKHIPHPNGGYVTVSIGVASIENGRGADSAEALLRMADRALYGAKSRGRNCVCSNS